MRSTVGGHGRQSQVSLQLKRKCIHIIIYMHLNASGGMNLPCRFVVLETGLGPDILFFRVSVEGLSLRDIFPLVKVSASAVETLQ